MTIAASGSSFSYSAAVAVAITTDVAAVAAAAMIAAAANGISGRKVVRYPQKVASRSNSAGIFFTKNQ